VAQGIVDVLEAVQVDHQNGAVLRFVVEERIKCPLEVQAIREAGQGVVKSLDLQLADQNLV